jgi:endonuclease-3
MTRAPKPYSPAEIVEGLAPLYGRPAWEPHHDPMAELVLTILSQNTSDTNSGRAFMRLLERFPTWPQVADAPVEEIEAAIQVGGLAHTKAPRIKAVVQSVAEHTSGTFDLQFLAGLPLDEAKAWLRSLGGVGPKTAACVLMFALGRPALPVDTHVHRVAGRLGLIPAKATAEQAHNLLEARLAPDDVFPFHVMLIKHGRRLCTARNPNHAACPLAERCPAAATVIG